MEPTQIMAKKTMKMRFIILQVLTLLLVAVVLVSFSDVSIMPKAANEKLPMKKAVNGNQPANNETVAALENNLLTYQNLVKEKQNKINELEASVKNLQTDNSGATSSANETALKADVQKLELELSEKEATINELVGRIQTLEKAKPSAPATSDKALVDKLRADIQRLETRNELLVKLNNDLKKNNEYLSSQQKP